MLVIAHAIAITCYIAAAGLAAAPFARPIAAPVRGVVSLLSAGVAVHLMALLAYTWQFGAAPLAALVTIGAIASPMAPGPTARAAGTVWLVLHVALSLLGFAAFATAAASGVMYLLERRELKSRRFGAIFRFFPPLETLDRVNHLAIVCGWIALTLGVILALGYSIVYRDADHLKVIWGIDRKSTRLNSSH